MKRKRLGEILIEAGVIDSARLDQALQEVRSTGKRLGEILVFKGWVKEDDIMRILGKQLKLPVVMTLSQRKIRQKTLDLVPPSFCFQKQVLPLGFEGRFLWVAMSNPTDYSTLDDVAFITGHPVKRAIAPQKEILDYICRFHTPSLEEQDKLWNKTGYAANDVQVVENIHDQHDISFDKLEKAAKGGVIRQLINGIIVNAIQRHASDIHIEAQQDDVVVRYRIDGIMQDVMTFTKTAHPPAVSRIKIMASLDITIRRKPQDGRARIRIGEVPYDLRISSLPTYYGEKIVIRILEPQVTYSLSKLGIGERELGRVMDCLKRPQGLILVTGPTGSGKTTTLYAAISHIFSPEINIVTIEDPIEYSLPGVNQVQVNPATGMTFARGLRSLLRQDPDVVMIGEIRDAETAGIAMQAAQTGHLVLSTLHTNDAVGAVTRLKDMGIEPFLISNSLLCVLGQRLVRKIHPDCCAAQEIPPAVMAQFPPTDPSRFKYGTGCTGCQGTGYLGRIGVYELLEVTEEIAGMITDRATDKKILAEARGGGMRSMTEDGFDKARGGITTLDEVIRIVPPSEQTPTARQIKPPSIHRIQNGAGNIQPEMTESGMENLRRDRILVIDDDEAIRRIVGKMLTNEFYEVDSAGDGLEGLNIIFEHPPDLILVDCEMPNMSGIVFIDKIKSHSRLRTIPVIMLTATEAEETEVEALTLGADDWISKPIQKKRLLARIKRLLKKG